MGPGVRRCPNEDFGGADWGHVVVSEGGGAEVPEAANIRSLGGVRHEHQGFGGPEAPNIS